MSASQLGTQFEREIREQPRVWERLAVSDKASQLARVLDEEIVLVGSVYNDNGMIGQNPSCGQGPA